MGADSTKACRFGIIRGEHGIESFLSWRKSMKILLLPAAVGMALAGFSVASVAACAAPAVRVNNVQALTTLLQGNTVCVPVNTQPTMDWQELHQAGGVLIDYKRGPGHAVDPSEPVGTWTVSTVGLNGVFVTHNYGAGGSFVYSVWNNGDGTHSFCSSSPEVKARIKPGGGAC
jgi:hypothetical protein